MKKTIAMAALCLGISASASAITLEDAVLSVPSYNGTAEYNGDFCTMSTANVAQTTVMVVVDLTKLPVFESTSVGTSLFTLRDGDATQSGAGITLTKWGSNNSNPVAWTSWNDAKRGAHTSSNLTNWDDAEGKTVLTLSLDGTKTTAGKLYASNGTIIDTVADDSIFGTGANYDSLELSSNADVLAAIDGIYVFNQFLGADDVKTLSAAAIAAAAVPEPATATLSLLALAGLAARRRRK